MKTVSIVVRSGNDKQTEAVFTLMQFLHQLGIVWVQEVMDARPYHFRMYSDYQERKNT